MDIFAASPRPGILLWSGCAAPGIVGCSRPRLACIPDSLVAGTTVVHSFAPALVAVFVALPAGAEAFVGARSDLPLLSWSSWARQQLEQAFTPDNW